MNRLLLPSLSLVILSILNSCEQSSSVQTTSLANARNNEDTTFISAEPSENVSVEDYWDEAKSIRSEAEQIIQRANDAGCKEATKKALYSITLTEQAEQASELDNAERLTGQSNQALSAAVDALTSCEEGIDQVYPAVANK